jgi:hypothetical protein
VLPAARPALEIGKAEIDPDAIIRCEGWADATLQRLARLSPLA